MLVDTPRGRPLICPGRPPDTRTVARHYDELDAFYRELWGEDLHHGLWLRGDENVEEATENLTRFVAECAGITAGDRVCDVGCGYGTSSRFYADRLGAHVVGVTVSRAQLRHAHARGGGDGRAHFVLCDWLRNPFPTGRFNVVVAVESASHMADKPLFLGECHRVLRGGGRLVAATWLAAQRATRWQRRFLLEPICEEGRLAGLATASEYRRWMEAAGLGCLAFHDLSRDVGRTWSVSLRRIAERVARDPQARRYLLDPQKSERRFALTVARMWLAYRTGALAYGVFTARAR